MESIVLTFGPSPVKEGRHKVEVIGVTGNLRERTGLLTDHQLIHFIREWVAVAKNDGQPLTVRTFND